MVFIGNILYQSVTKYILKKNQKGKRKKRNKSDKWFYIEILVYPSVTNCNKTAYLEKKSEREEKKNVTRATNVFYREYFVSVCNKVQPDHT